jgi:ligand-binding sensor protein
MKLDEICPLSDWVQLEKEIYEMSGLSASVFGTDGVRISDFHKWANDLCPEIKANEKGQAFICAVAHMNIAAQAQQTHQSVIEECDAGMVKMVVPIFVDDAFIGAVGACGQLLDEGEADSFLINKITEIEEVKIEKLAQGIKHLPLSRAEEIKTYIQQRVEQIVQAYEVKKV